MRQMHYVTMVLLLIIGGIPALFVTGAIAGLPAYVYPSVDPMPAKADVVYVIGPPTRARLLLARKLLDEGVSDTMLLSVSPHVLQSGDTERKFRKCNVPGGDVVCISPTPFNTYGESVALEQIAQERGWDSAVVITRTSHVLRTRMFMHRCFQGNVAVIDSQEPSDITTWAYQYAYQSGAFLKSLTETGC
jgi:DUF218 domain